MTAPLATTASERAAEIAALCKQATRTTTGWQCCCPAHDDTTPSLSISTADDRVLLHCHAGCSVEAIVGILMLDMADLFGGTRARRNGTRDPIEITYDYVDSAGTLRYQSVRFASKKFRQRQPDPANPDVWIWNLKGVTPILYRLPDTLAAIRQGRAIYIVEGEKDTDTLWALGLAATCNPMGAGKWRAAYGETLRGADCRVLPDHDEPGARHAQHIASMLTGIAAFVRIVEGIHTEAPGSDVSDWLQAGHTGAELEDRARQTPLWVRARTAGTLTVVAGNAAETPRAQGTLTTGAFDPETLYTDDYNGRALVREHGTNLRYCYPWKAWLVWTGTHWQRDTSGIVMQLAKHTIKDLARLMHDMDNDQCSALMKHIKASLSINKLKAMVESAQSIQGIAVQPDEFDRDLLLLNCANGTIDLRTGTLRAAVRTDLITKCLSVTYDHQAPCPRWEAFLDRAMGGKQGLVAFLHRAVGYSLTGSTIEQCLFILHGPTKTGKTTFLARLRSLLGPYGTQADMDSFMHRDREGVRNDLADLTGRRVVCAVEAQEGRRLNEALIKQLTGGLDQIKARFLFEEFFTFVPQFKIFIGTNHKPVIKDSNQAIWERIRLVPFIVHIPPNDRDKTLDEVLQLELPGILAWAVRGCLEWQRRGDLDPPPEVLNATAEWQHESDVIGRFITERCVLLDQAQVRAGVLWEAYKTWCDKNGEPWDKLRSFGEKISERGFEKRQSNGINYLGIGIRSEDQD